MKATIECKKCGIVGKLEKVWKFEEAPRSIVPLYLPKGWRALKEEPYCKKCSNIIFEEIDKLLQN